MGNLWEPSIALNFADVVLGPPQGILLVTDRRTKFSAVLQLMIRQCQFQTDEQGTSGGCSICRIF